MQMCQSWLADLPHVQLNATLPKSAVAEKARKEFQMQSDTKNWMELHKHSLRGNKMLD